MGKFIIQIIHYIVGLAVIAAIACLVVVGKVSGDVGVPIITGIGSALGVGGLVQGKSSTS